MMNDNRRDRDRIHGSERKKEYRRKISAGRRVLACLLVVALVLNIFPSSLLDNIMDLPYAVHAANKDSVDTPFTAEEDAVQNYKDENGVYVLNDVTKVLNYSRAYYSFSDIHEEDTIVLGFGEGNSSDPIPGFIALGTVRHPFKGTILINTSADNTLKIPEAFFDYVYDSVKIVSYTDETTPYDLVFQRITTADEPVLARHIRHDSDLQDVNIWKVTIDSYGSDNYNTSGFIGEIEAGAKLNFEITDNTSMNIANGGNGETNDTGYVCGKMGVGSELTISSISGSNTSYSVTASAGHAGGVVGSIETGATLCLGCQMANASATVTASGSGKYAGGIVGYNDGGKVVSGKIDGTPTEEDPTPDPVDIFTASNKFIISNTLVGTAGAGGVYGYYKPAFSANATTGVNEASFDIASLQIGASTSSRITANGMGSIGGLFGVLENEIATTTGEGESVTTTYSSGIITITDSTDNGAIIYTDHSAGAASNYGGLIGKYSACNLAGALSVESISVNSKLSSGTYSNYGGGIGETSGIQTNSVNAVYVKFDDFQSTVASGNSTSASVYGGLVALSHNSFIDANDVKASSTANFYGGGVIGRMEDGVLRLSGNTDLTGGYAQISGNGYYNEGQIVGGRDNSVIFAEKDWILMRSNTCSVDDIGSWGEVLRFTGINTTSTDGVVTATEERYGANTVLTVNETAHTVEVASHSVSNGATTISSEADFAKVALCFQINATENPCLSFNSGWGSVDFDDINSVNITLGADIILTGTGLTGFTRDNQSGSDSTYCVYSGRFDGGNHKITLAIGEPYGRRGDTVLSDHSAEGNGKIYRHLYNGLFGIVDGDYNTTNYTVKDLTLTGSIDISARKVGDDKITLIYCGGYAARALQDFTATNVKTEAATSGSESSTGFRVSQGGDCKLYMGRLVGEMGSDIELISIATSEFGGSISGGNSNVDSCFGGVIGRISHNTDATRTWNFNTVTLKGSVSNSRAKDNQRIGGLVAEIDGDYSANSSHRTVTLNGVTTDGLTVNGTINSNGASGGLLGYKWLKTDVNATDVTVNNTSTVDIGSVAGNTAGIVYQATGQWTVTKLDIRSLKMTANSAASIGVIVNKGYYPDSNFYSDGKSSAIYLKLPSSYTYNLTLSGEDINSSAVFDELCAYTCPSSDDIMKNGNGIISVHNNFYTNGSTASGTYHAQSSYGAKPNPNARYYYNLDTVTSSSANDAIFTYNATTNPGGNSKKLMSWGLNCYACENLKQYFADPFSGTITNATYDMTGYSWYPINLDNSITLNGTFKLYNQEFEESELLKYTTENTADSTTAYKRTSLYDSTKSSNTQHYMLHNALFNDINSCTLTIGNVTLQGDVNAYKASAITGTNNSATYCGALVCGTVSGSSSSNVGTVIVNTGISLDGIKVNNYSSFTSYAPLLINKLGSHSKLEISDVTTTTGYNYDSNSDSANDSSYIVATSLIGDAGNSSATDININFKGVTLDGRNSTGKANTDLSDTSKGNFLAMYNTYNSIFGKATLLNSFSYSSGSSGVYNFTWAKDWDTNNDSVLDGTHLGKVTYGKELGYDKTNYPKAGANSPYYNSQYPDEEFMYFGSTTYYTNPIDGNDTDHTYEKFVTNFIPYVATKYKVSDKTYQLQVNHGTTSTSGCGTYNHPYVITSATDIVNYCDWLNNGGAGISVRIPIGTGSLSFNSTTSTQIDAIIGTWCENKETDALCVWNTDHYEIIYKYDVVTPAGSENPNEEGWYEHSYAYVASEDTVIVSGKQYYEEDENEEGTYNEITDHGEVTNPSEAGWYERKDAYSVSENTTVDAGKTYYKADIRTLSVDVLRTYLAGAYYKVAENAVAANLEIASTSTFDGFGKSDTNAFRFRGVFDGNNKTIVNKTTAPFIYYSNGSVVKDLTISVQPASAITITGKQADFSAINNNEAYGAVMARVMGGDNIIDNVSVGYSSMSSSLKINVNGGYAQLAPVGGYVGVVVNGGVYFRNMGTAAAAYFNSANPTGLQNSQITSDVTKTGKSTNYSEKNNMLDSKNWLYVNPVVGRVINGFAVTESDAYRPYEKGTRKFGDGTTETGGEVTLKNGTKHYSIADINASETNGTKNDQIAISSNAVTVSGGQDFFLMSLIVNSGMAKKALGYNQNYQVSRSAAYSDVGTSESSSTDYTSYATNDKLSSSGTTSEFGLLAKKYVNNTSITGNLANNQNLTITLSADVILPDGYKGMGNIYKNNASNNNLTDNYLMKVKTFTGNGHIISQNSSLLLYVQNDMEKYYYPVSNDGACGFGLFNYQGQAGTYNNVILKGNVTTDLINHLASSNNDNYDAEKGYAPYLYTNGNMNKGWLPATGSLFGVSNAAMTLQSVALQNVKVCGTRYTGGMIGYHPANSKITITNTVAGLGSDKIIVIGGLTVGGLIGKKYQGALEFDNKDSSGNPCTFNITNVESLCTAMTESGKYYDYGVGGLIGVSRGNGTQKLTIKNFTMGNNTTQTVLSNVKCEKANIYTGGLFGILNRQYLEMDNCTINNMSVETQLAAGGVIGHWATSAHSYENDAVLPYTSYITNTRLICNVSGAKVKSSGAKNGSDIDTSNIKFSTAGGMIGSCKQDLAPLIISDCSVEGYNIDGYTYAGGVVGAWGDSSTYAAGDQGRYQNHNLVLKNDSVINCDIDSNSSAGYSGGLLGNLNNSGDDNPDVNENKMNERYFNLIGYNLLVKNISLTGSEFGYVCGLTSDKNMKDDIMHTVIKLVGYTRQDTRTGDDYAMEQPLVGSTSTASDSSPIAYGANGYIIFADYAGSCLGSSGTGYSTSFPTLDGYSATNVTLASPYVTSTDPKNIDATQFLTGDAVGYNSSITYANSRIGSILSDASGGTAPKRYSTAYTKVGATNTSELITKLDTYGKYSNYKAEISNAGTTYDFPVLVVDDVIDSECTDFLNEYLQFMTNSDFNFAGQMFADGTTSASTVFNIEIGAMNWNSGQSKFVYTSGTYNSSSNANGAYLSNNVGDKKFRIDGTHYDNVSENGRFTLMDVQFYDPADPSKIAYHLYVPILVKKMLQYDFYASILSGTNYRVPPYEAVRTTAKGNTLIENIGNPVTMEVQWRYYRTLEEWQTSVNGGENLLRTLDKNITFTKHTGAFPSDTKMVLVDPNNSNKYYYAETSDMSFEDYDDNTGKISEFHLDKFKDSDNTAFAPVDFNDYFNFAVTSAIPEGETVGTGGYDKVTLTDGTEETKDNYITEGATLRVPKNSGGFDYYKPNTVGTGAYNITLSYKSGVYDSSNYITENYYITFFTDKSAPTTDSKKLYHLDFYDSGTFNAGWLPTKSVYNTHTHLLTGDIFVNDFEIDGNSVNTNSEISASNDQIYATLKATVGVKLDIRDDVKPYLSSTYTTVSVYQSFLVMLDRMAESREKGILAKPVIDVNDFTIKHTTGGNTDTDVADAKATATSIMSDVYELLTPNYIEIRDNINLRDYLYRSCNGGYNLDIQATVNLSYPDTVSQTAQFPTRDSSNINNDEIGTVIGAASGISSVASAAAYSNTYKEDWDDTPYYVTINTNAILTLNSDDALNEFGDYYQLGINDLDMDAEGLALDEDGNSEVKLNAVYDVSDLSKAGTANSMKLTISVRKKADYNTKLEIDDYITSLKLYAEDKKGFSQSLHASNITINEATGATEYTYIIQDPTNSLDYDVAAQTYYIPITYSVFAGNKFNGQYSNYMIKLEAEMYTDTSATAANMINGSHDDDHIIWTNARILHEVFDH